MKRAIAGLLLAVSTAAGAMGWVLINQYYDSAAQGWVCTYRSPQGTIITQIQRSFCSFNPQ